MVVGVLCESYGCSAATVPAKEAGLLEALNRGEETGSVSVAIGSVFDRTASLLHIPPLVNGGTYDPGWNCRDHALVVGCVIRLMGHNCCALHGRATFCLGPIDGLPPVGLQAAPHSWLGIDQHGYLDVSVRLSSANEPRVQNWPLVAIAGRSCYPIGDFREARTTYEYEDAVARASNTAGARWAIYLGETYDDISAEILSNAFRWANSPLTEILRAKYEPSIYAQAAIHLFDFLNGNATSLASRSPEEAWATLSRMPGNAVNRVASRGGLR